MEKNRITFQRVPPHVHQRNAAERAIQTFKNHFVSGLATSDPTFPIHEWDRLIPQAQLTLNLLRISRVNQQLSAHAILFGNFDFNKTPLAPPGTKVLIHSKPKDRNSWGFHGRKGWYTTPSPEHYRCVKCFIPETHRTVDTDTVDFFPHKVPSPEIISTDFLEKAALDILTILHHKN